MFAKKVPDLLKFLSTTNRTLSLKRVLLLCVLFASAGLAPLAVQAEEIEKVSLAPVDAVDIQSKVDNFDRVSDSLYRGAQPSDNDLSEMHKAGLKTVIDLRKDGPESDRESVQAAKLGMQYVHIPMSLKRKPSPEQLALFMSTVTNPINQPVFVHCRQGADRTGTCCAVYRMLIQNWTYRRAYREMRVHGFKPFLPWMKKVVKNCHTLQLAKRYNENDKKPALSSIPSQNS